MNQPFCPIYKEARDFLSQSKQPDGNSGLRFEKFGDAWNFQQKSGMQVAEFDKENLKSKTRWLDRFVGKANQHGDSSQLEAFAERQSALVKSLGGVSLILKNESRFVTGMGRQHPLENGFSWHHILGTPYLPGTSVKGGLRSWAREVRGTWDEEKEEYSSDIWIDQAFGEMEQVGEFILFDMIPLKKVELVAEIMTPHFGKYYQDGEIPGDWHSPVPVSYLAVEKGQNWQLGIAPRKLNNPEAEGKLEEITDLLVQSLQFAGVGAKTSIGMGRFERDQALENKISARLDAKRQKAADQEKRAAEDAKLSDDVRAIVKIARERGWEDADNSTAFLDGMDDFLENNPAPSVEVIDWVRENIIESDSVSYNKPWHQIWLDPEAMGGKKKNKPKFKGRIKELVIRLIQLREGASS